MGISALSTGLSKARERLVTRWCGDKKKVMILSMSPRAVTAPSFAANITLSRVPVRHDSVDSVTSSPCRSCFGRDALSC